MDGDWALLTDFGLARMTEASVKLTGSGVGVGTPAYMSPEQGQGKEVDQRTDVYSLGIILYEMLTGQIPHDAETPFAIVLKRITEPLPIPRALDPDIPEAVERVILKALAREPEDRYASTGAMAEALEQAVREPALAQAEEPSLGYPEAEPLPAGKEPAAIGLETPTTVRRAFPWKGIAGIGAVGIVIALLGMWLGGALERASTPTPTAAAAWVPTATHTIASATDTPQPVPTDTPKPPTPTLPNTVTPTPTSTPKPVPTDTPQPAPTGTAKPPTATASKAVTPVPASMPEPTLQVREKDGAVMVYVPAGELRMGSEVDDHLAVPDEKPRHVVHVDAFWMDRTEVTNAQYRQCVDAGACSAPQSIESLTRASYHDNPEFDAYPVVYVTWHQARAYAEWVGGRLPTEAQWEYAARGPGGTIYPWGNGAAREPLLNCCDRVGDTTEVGSYPDGASWCGALDMAGNVWEWTSSLRAAYPYDGNDGRENLDAKGARVVRGGSFVNNFRSVRSAYRWRYDSGHWRWIVGFRVVLSAG
jgi:serine/threonine-protein kinase